jgi:hypothetical protein
MKLRFNRLDCLTPTELLALDRIVGILPRNSAGEGAAAFCALPCAKWPSD